jgi:hypothetical protein
MTDSSTTLASETPAEKLAALKARRKALADAAEAERLAQADTEAIRLEERGLRDDEARAAARREHGTANIATVTGVGAKGFDCVIVKRAHPAAFKAFQERDGFKLDDLEKLVEPCIVYPPLSEFSSFATHEQPGVLTRVAEAVFWLMGVRKSAELGKA